MESKDDTKLADIGDATLVSSNDVVEVKEEEKKQETEQTNAQTSSNDNETNTEQTTSTNINKDDYFAKSKLERDTMYSQMIETYNKVLNSNNSLETQKQTATEEITKINETKNKIMICENLIKTKGFENSVIFVNGQSVSAIIGAQEIKQEEIAQIQNIISREMNVDIENIHIATK